jgi:isoamylase
VRAWAGKPFPLGASWDGEGTNFSLFSAEAHSVDLLLFDDVDGSPTEKVRLSERSGQVWHAYLPDVAPGRLYAYSVDGPHEPNRGLRFNRHKALLDPYARAVAGRLAWNDALFGYKVGDPAQDLSFDERDSSPFVPKGVVIDTAFDWEGDRLPRTPWNETIIYELHVKGFTKLRQDVEGPLRGTYAGLASPGVVGYLKDLGITAVELMPVQQHVDNKFLVDRGLSNYWGYNTIGYFAPDSRYSGSGDHGEQVNEFKAMVKALHRAGIEVILDVVYNHTAEGNQLGPTLSFRGVDNRAYYRLARKNMRNYFDVTGTGNSLNVSNPFVIQMVMDSLRYWATDMHVDGFRFDLAPALARENYEFDRFSTFLEVVQQDPEISRVKLIAEPWDLGPRGYQAGNFPPVWSEWNDRFRDATRRFWKSELVSPAEMATRLAGSSDMYGSSARGPDAGINYVTCHDGFTLNDLVSYNTKHNGENGEDNRDGSDYDHSWNHGHEGPTENQEVRSLRKRQMMNFIATLFLSQGVPMLLAGDELMRTQGGNNNAYSQDNGTSWLDWSESPEKSELLEFTRRMIAIRKGHAVFRRRKFFQGKRVFGGRKDLVWLRPDGSEIQPEDWRGFRGQTLCALLWGPEIDEYNPKGERALDDPFLLVMNGSPEELKFSVPEYGFSWEVVVDTSGRLVAHDPYLLADGGASIQGRSLVLLRRAGC